MLKREQTGMWSLCLLLVFSACSSAAKAPKEGEIVSSAAVEGQRIPHGSSGSLGRLRLDRIATDPTYGFTARNPVKVAGLADSGPRSERTYLSALRGPSGEEIQFERRGSCCPFETANSGLGTGMLDVYEITYPGLPEPLVLYLDMYDPSDLMVPVGLSSRQ